MPKQHLDVFISSTSIDLPEHRKAVVDALLSIGLFPSGMEHWPTADEDPEDFCHQKVREAELFVGIYAHRYGWRPGGPGTPSITEMEYDWAGELKIPRFCFIMSDDHPWPRSLMELDAQDDLDAFKSRVSEKVRGTFNTPDDLAKQVLAALAPYAQKQDLSGLTPYLRRLHHDAMQSGLLRTLDARTSDLTFRGRPITVDQVYTPLDTRTSVPRADDGHIEWEKLERRLGEKVREEDSHEEALSPLGAMEAVSHYDRLVLLGDPGSGKSTLIQFLILGLAGHHLDRQSNWLDRLQEQGWEHEPLLPVLVTLRDFAQDMGEDHEHGTAQSILGHLQRVLEQHGCGAEIGALQAALRSGGVLLMVDGLDEVPSEKREVVRDAVTEFMTAYPCRVLITCRILSYANPEWRIPETATVTLAPFDEDKIAHFIQAWYHAAEALGNISPDLAQARIKDLTRASGDPRLRDMATNPMLLTVMAIVHNHQGHLPEQTAKLYQDCVEMLMLKWRPEDARHLREVLRLSSEADLYRILWHIAFYAHETQGHQSGAADLRKADLLELVAEDHLQGDFGQAEQFCHYVEERAGLLIGRGGADGRRRVYAFPHRTFQEFLAGCYIADDMRYLELFAEKARAGANWREVLRLATGHMLFNKLDRNAPIMAAQCLLADEPVTEPDWRAVWLAGEMLLLVGLSTLHTHPIGKTVLAQARQRLAALVSEGHLEPVERAECGRTLGLLGDPRPGVLAPNGVPEFAWCEVPARPFRMGGDPEAWGAWEGAEFDLPYPFWIAKYPVTYAQYEPFVAAGGYTERRYWTDAGWSDKGERTEPYLWNDAQWHIANHPVVGVTWYEAYAYTQWLDEQRQRGKLVLPSEIPAGYVIRLARECEWEKAARYPDGRRWPWGNEWDDGRRVNWDGSGIGRTSAVGIFPHGANPAHGACDLIGNVWEWCLTQWAERYPSPDGEKNDPNGNAGRCVRGGSWGSLDALSDLRAAARNRSNPNYGITTSGFGL